MLFVLRNAGMNAAIEDSFSQLLAWTLTNKFQSTGAEDYILKQKVLSLLEWVCVTYMFRMGLLLYVKNPSTPPTSCRKADKPPTPLSTFCHPPSRCAYYSYTWLSFAAL